MLFKPALFLYLCIAGLSISALFDLFKHDYDDLIIKAVLVLFCSLFYFLPERIKAHGWYLLLIIISLFILFIIFSEVKDGDHIKEQNGFNCELGKKGSGGHGVDCECLCSGYAEDQKSDIYDYEGISGCLGTIWMCKGGKPSRTPSEKN